MLDAQIIVMVETTAPLLAKTDPKLTARFYDRMFAHNPGLKEIFNMNNQCNDDRREALFNAIATHVSNIGNLPTLLSAVEKIAQEHTSFQIRPEQYNIIGSHLLTTFDKMFSPDQEVPDVWSKAYGVLASVFIGHEIGVYQQNTSKTSGWEGTRAFRVVKKTPRNQLITSFELEPVDSQPVAGYQLGQYLAIWLKPESFEYQRIRQYSLTRKADGKGYRIMVKREDGGQVFSWLYSHAGEGDVVYLVVPAGDFLPNVEPQTLVTLFSGGVGQVPMLAMLDALAKSDRQGQANWFHAAENGDVHVFADEVSALSVALPAFTSHVWYRSPNGADRQTGHLDNKGLMDLVAVAGNTRAPQMQFYLCDPVMFMQFAAKQLVESGANKDNIHYECFGPHKVL